MNKFINKEVSERNHNSLELMIDRNCEVNKNKQLEMVTMQEDF